MGFVDSYKHLEKLCGDILNDDRRVSAYIDEMLRTPQGSCYVRTWDEDLRTLKHYRWVRNKISHEPDCTEQTMCEPKDALWLDAFYSRIMHQTDPLSLYRQATCHQSKPNLNKNLVQISPPDRKPNRFKRSARTPLGYIVLILLFLLFIVWLILSAQSLYR